MNVQTHNPLGNQPPTQPAHARLTLACTDAVNINASNRLAMLDTGAAGMAVQLWQQQQRWPVYVGNMGLAAATAGRAGGK